MTDLTVEGIVEALGVDPRAAADLVQSVERMKTGSAAIRAARPVRRQRLRIMELGRVTGLLPEGRSGDWSVERFAVTEEQSRFEVLRAAVSSSSRGRFCEPGEYTGLYRAGSVVMSDTPDELLDLSPLRVALDDLAAERVLIHGLGLGCALRIVLACPTVLRVDVVELSEDVIRLVGPTFAADPRVEVVQGNAYTHRFPAGTSWDVAWHDIWDNISIDNDFATLHRRYGRRVRWQGSWCREEAIAADRRYRRENAWWLDR